MEPLIETGTPVLWGPVAKEDVRQTQVKSECDIPVASANNVTGKEAEAIKKGTASASEPGKEGGNKEADQGKAVLAAVLLFIIIILVLYLISKVSSHARKQE